MATLGVVTLEFGEGKLKYEIKLPDKKQIMLLTYQIDGDEVVTDQPSHPRPERTKFELGGGVLTLTFAGGKGRFLKL